MNRLVLALALSVALAGCSSDTTMGPTLLRDVAPKYPKEAFTCLAVPPKPQLDCAPDAQSCDRSKELAAWITALWFSRADCADKLTAAGKMVSTPAVAGK